MVSLPTLCKQELVNAVIVSLLLLLRICESNCSTAAR